VTLGWAPEGTRRRGDGHSTGRDKEERRRFIPPEGTRRRGDGSFPQKGQGGEETVHSRETEISWNGIMEESCGGGERSGAVERSCRECARGAMEQTMSSSDLCQLSREICC